MELKRRAPQLVPLNLKGKAAHCPSCGFDNIIDWLSELDDAIAPVPLRPDFYAVPTSLPIECVKCDRKYGIDIPSIEEDGRWALYGDESARHISKEENKQNSREIFFFCYTLVGLHISKHDEVRKNIYELKKSIKLNNDPRRPHHFTTIWSKSAETGIHNLETKESKVEYAKKFAKMLWNAQPELAVFNISGCVYLNGDKKEKSKQMKICKEDIFSRAIMTTTDIMTSHRKSITWTFDNEQNTKSGPKIEGWTHECFRGLQHTRLFSWLSRRTLLHKPTHIEPGTHYLSEIADFISFWIARDFFMGIKKKRIEMQTYELGEILYEGTLGNGDAKAKNHISFPLKEFYGIDRSF